MNQFCIAIYIDLHIHSKASSYKEDGDIVRNSDASHIDVLIDKLTENHISLFSITEHNRFDASLYKVLNGRLEQEDSSTKAVLLPGVEYDVELQPGKTPAHMIAIFDGKSPDDYDLIEKSIDTCGRLSSKSDYYSVDAFEKVLKTISLRVILIAHQHSGFNGNQRSRSLGKATDNVLDLYKYGYIDALEYNSSKIQGILRGELADLDLPDRMLIGTDCHEWEYYPRHDKASADREFEFATVRALPSFQGLLMALTSPKTRIGVKPPEEKPDYCQAIELCGKTIPFSPGLNVIIGENGSGKSSMLNLLCDSDCRKTHVQKVKNEYGFTCEKRPFDPIYIKQGDLQDRYNKGIVFDSALFENPDNTGFSSIVRSYSTSLKKLIKHNIGRKKQHDQTSSTNFIFDDKFESKTFSFTVVCPENFANDDNPWSMRVDTLKGIENMLAQEITNKEYDEAELKKTLYCQQAR